MQIKKSIWAIFFFIVKNSVFVALDFYMSIFVPHGLLCEIFLGEFPENFLLIKSFFKIEIVGQKSYFFHIFVNSNGKFCNLNKDGSI